MKKRVVAAARLVALGSIALCVAIGAAACGQRGQNITDSFVPTSKDSIPPPARVATFVLSFGSELVIGTPSTSVVSAVAYDAHGNVITGRYSPAISVVDKDASGQTSLSGKTMASSTQTLKLNYSGKGDRFKIQATAGLTQHTYPLVTTLPPEVPLASPGPGSNTVPSEMRFGSDGNLWTVVYGNNVPRNPITVARITTAGNVTLFSDPNNLHEYSGAGAYPLLTQGSDGAIWFDFYDMNSGLPGLDRVDSSGSFTSFVPQNNLSYLTALARGPSGAVWFVESNLNTSNVYEIQTNGATSLIASAIPGIVKNLVLGADGNMWFGDGTQVGKVTPAGALTLYTLAGVKTGTAPLLFVVGPDGNFWLPYPFWTDNELVKFNTSGNVVSIKQYHQAIPRVFDVGTDSDSVWVADNNYGIVRIASDGTASEFPTYMPNSNPLSLTVGTDRRVYFADTVSLGQNSYSGALGSVSQADW